jgi:dephospho-CoA kinase
MIIGITGTFGAGKGTTVEYLKKNKRFIHLSAGGFLAQELQKEGKAATFENMANLGNELRAANSPSYLVEILFEQAKNTSGDCVIESLRTVGEINDLREKGHFTLLAIDAEQKLRYDRNVKRGTESDNLTFDEFVKSEEKQLANTDPNKQNLLACIKMADYLIINNGTKKELFANIEMVFRNIQLEFESSGCKERKF